MGTGISSAPKTVFHSISRHPEADSQAVRSKIELGYAGERAH